MSTDENSSSLTTKYNRLISDYKNLRDKHNFLKTALIAERDKSKELESLFVENGIQSRKHLQEIESLKFRNDMLSKQLNTLRDELDVLKSSKKGSSKSKDSNVKQDDSDIFKEELMSKIDECSNLHSQLSSLKLEYQMDTNNFRSAINDLENQLKLIKNQNNTTEQNIRKALANEIEERTALETKLENKDNLIQKLEKAEQSLFEEVKELKHKLQNQTASPCSSIHYHKDLHNDLDNDSVKSKEFKKPESLNGSMTSINNDNLNTNEIYVLTLIDKISQLEQKLIALEMENQVTTKRQEIEKKHRNLYEEYIIRKGDELPKLDSTKSSSLSAKCEKFLLSDNNQLIVDFYEKRITLLNKQIYQAIGRAALFYDEATATGKRLEIECLEKVSLRDEIEAMKQKMISNQDDLDLTRVQYEKKMGEMSIHIAELNTQLDCKKINSQKNHMFGDNSNSSNDNVSSIKGFINSLKK